MILKQIFGKCPKGGIDNHESPREAMIRELGEEVGIKKNFEIIEESKSWLKYQLPQEIKKSLEWKIYWTEAKMVCL